MVRAFHLDTTHHTNRLPRRNKILVSPFRLKETPRAVPIRAQTRYERYLDARKEALSQTRIKKRGFSLFPEHSLYGRVRCTSKVSPSGSASIQADLQLVMGKVRQGGSQSVLAGDINAG